jgi:hypothetical protein
VKARLVAALCRGAGHIVIRMHQRENF